MGGRALKSSVMEYPSRRAQNTPRHVTLSLISRPRRVRTDDRGKLNFDKCTHGDGRLSKSGRVIRTSLSLTVNLDGELGLGLAPHVARLAAVDAFVLVAPQVRDDERRLLPVAVLVVRRQQDVAVLQIE